MRIPRTRAVAPARAWSNPISAVIRATIVSVLALSAACESPTGDGRMLFEISLHVVSGDGQAVVRGGGESEPLVVRVQDQDGVGRSGLIVEWTVSEGEGTVTLATGVSNAEGLASTTYVSGDAVGEVEVTATARVDTSGGLSAGRPIAPVSFTLTVASENGSGHGS